MIHKANLLVIPLVLSGLLSSSVMASPRALPQGKLPEDRRLGPLKDLNGYFPFDPNQSRQQWETRAEEVRRQILVSQGLWPLPARTPLNAVIHGKVDRGDYTVERVFFESLPGFYVTGSLYRPKGKSGKLPVVLCPHGHWTDGRFYDMGVDKVRKEIVDGAERFEEGGRSPLQSRCVQLARMGCVVFFYDMIGYADSQQISYDLAHRFAKQRPEMNTLENWGLYSPQAEARLQNVMGLQTWNSIRALDFVETLPDVDTSRIAVTGASGGGTQTFLLGAIDPRPAVTFPAVMVSTAMQGGCTCENASLLRVETGNIEFAALFAPKPQGLTAANDWTKEMATKGFPELKEHYKRMGAPDNVMLKPLVHFGHNYNYVSRAAMYPWMNKHLKLGLKEPIVEEDYKRLSVEEATVWNAQHPKPQSGPDFEQALLRHLTEDANRQLKEARSNPERYRQIVGGAVESMIGRKLSEAGKTELKISSQIDRGNHVEVVGLLKNVTHEEELPVVLLKPKAAKGRTVIWISEEGKAGLFTAAEIHPPQVRPEVKRLLDAGVSVIGADLLYQGEFLADGKPLAQTRRVNNPREFAGYTLGYNHSLFAQRVHDILTVIAHVRQQDGSARVDLVGLDGTGPLAAAARAVADGAVDRAAINTGGFRFGKLLDLQDPNFLPGGAKYDDLPGLLALGAPGKLWLAGEVREGFDTVETLNRLSNAEKSLAPFTGKAESLNQAAIQWLLD